MDGMTILFFIVALATVVFSVLTVTTKRIIRAATYLLFVLFGTAGLYFILGFTFLGAVQVMVYAGGIVVLYVFSIFLTSESNENHDDTKLSKKMAALITTLAGAGIVMFILLTHHFTDAVLSAPSEYTISIKDIGHSMLSSGKYGYLLPFEAVSVLLLACIVAGLVIARKR